MNMENNVNKIGQKILPVLRRYDVVRAALFGSFARGDNKRNSDIDILVKFKGNKSLLDLSALKISLEALLKTDVDILTYNSLHPLLKERIINEQKVIL